jgi:hypothetical protein
MIATTVYVLCALTSIGCAVLLFRGYKNSGARLLFWAALCFAGLALNNIMVFVDERVVPSTDLSVVRSLPALFGVALFVYGLIWEVR